VAFTPRDWTNGEDVYDVDMDRLERGIAANATPYSQPPYSNNFYWASPVLGLPSNKPLSSLLNAPVWFPPMGSAVQGGVNLNTTTVGVAGDTVTVTVYGCLSDFTVDTATVIATAVVPIGTTLGRVEVATSFVIPEPYGLFAQITAYTAASPARLTSGSPQGISPLRNWSAGSSSGAVSLSPIDLPNIIFKRTS
jgi:hypothetical protein